MAMLRKYEGNDLLNKRVAATLSHNYFLAKIGDACGRPKVVGYCADDSEHRRYILRFRAASAHQALEMFATFWTGWKRGDEMLAYDRFTIEKEGSDIYVTIEVAPVYLCRLQAEIRIKN